MSISPNSASGSCSIILSGSELIGRHVAVETPTFGASVNVQLDGEVRNAVPMDDGSVRLGIEFARLTELEQSVFKALGVLSDAR